MAVLEKGVSNYPNHRSCFSCHHQALPLLSFSVGKLQKDSQAFHESAVATNVADFTLEAFSNKIDTLNQGGEIGGRALTVAYGLWTLDLAGIGRNATTEAMVEYLLRTQDSDGAWNFQSLRPPAASSRLMTSAVAVYGLRSYGLEDPAKTDQVIVAITKARRWSQQQQAVSHEDLIGQIWLEHMTLQALSLPPDENLGKYADQLLQAQRTDGGWAQTEDLPSDAYATGQAILMLSQVRPSAGPVNRDWEHPLARGVGFLLQTQQTDGSWLVASRSKPVQVFFDNGDPHGKDQFISMMATSWATAALREIQFATGRPLDSFRTGAKAPEPHVR